MGTSAPYPISCNGLTVHSLASADTHQRWRFEPGYEVTGEWQNRLCLAEPVDATRRRFFDRAFQVIDAGRFADAWFASIGDPDVAALPESEDVEDGAQDPVHFEHLGRTESSDAIADGLLDIYGPELVEHQPGRFAAHWYRDDPFRNLSRRAH